MLKSKTEQSLSISLSQVDIMEFAYEGGNAPENVCGFLLGLDVLGGQTCPSVAKRQEM